MSGETRAAVRREMVHRLLSLSSGRLRPGHHISQHIG